ncbi:MAG: DUF2059 domain-containing protein [Xanthomonadales bacterium]|nr:DUF2059 domain-containing protein [Xanthomonadales bacterium]
MLKRIALSCLCLSMAATSPAVQADEHSPEMAAAIELLALMDMETMIAGMQEQLHGMMREQMQDLLRSGPGAQHCPQLQATIDSFAGDTAALIGQSLSGETFLPEVAQVYVDVFSLEEIQAVTDFYRSPVGRKMLEKMPELMQRSIEISQRMVGEMMPGIDALVTRFASKAEAAQASCDADD